MAVTCHFRIPFLFFCLYSDIMSVSDTDILLYVCNCSLRQRHVSVVSCIGPI